MSDMGGSRKPLDLRPSANPQGHAPVQPRPVARPLAQRPAPAASRPAPTPRHAPQARPVASGRHATQTAPAPAHHAEPAPQVATKSSSTWKTALQFVIGVVIILLVAFSIVVLYVKYYAG